MSSTIPCCPSVVHPMIKQQKAMATCGYPILDFQVSRPRSKLTSFPYTLPSLLSFVIATQHRLQPCRVHDGSLVYKKSPHLHHSEGSKLYFIFSDSFSIGCLLLFFRCLKAQESKAILSPRVNTHRRSSQMLLRLAEGLSHFSQFYKQDLS